MFGRSVPKRFRTGTHRVLDPAETFDRVLPLWDLAGITRVSQLTGLDHIGIPVCAAVRPNSRSVSLAQGKGVTLEAAAASAVMEAVEVFHAEDLSGRTRFASAAALADAGTPAISAGLGRTRKPADPLAELPWIEAADLRDGQRILVPQEMVSTDYRVPRARGTGYFVASTNGLASGNHPVEAVLSAICELVERDAAALFAARRPAERAARLLDQESISDETCLRLLDRLRAAAMQVDLWDITTDIGIAACQCRLQERDDTPHTRLGPFSGFGCHPHRGIAISRAVTEAAQSRLTRIAGARDDLAPGNFEIQEAQAVWDALLGLGPSHGALRQFADMPHFSSDDLNDDLAWTVRNLARSGFDRIAVVDLSRAEFPVAVVRVIIPGLEEPHDHPDYFPGPRAAAVRSGPALSCG